ncbi:hypothetical protein CNEO2_560023 [Clostridium neonatale]|uniref:Uncharacterized protein n=1 Tax=Clostridium neonatale TaxID=137838 RepID=A0AAD1YCG2_9CLOT|nr:hypothetical protein CNEO2_1150002 [Clostridium neonatale]CAI3211962.1 hypothetical protein CNEO2_590017 [Clostridium neonatale]CAI3242554.1 hypothetical protein CNEO2_380015 [Clostridium neonatale]CAI3248071.1 hypothetical protein CNEO2_900004 [Clostridium neonatale]CAI3549357.1 hypothetical protein CNEO2_170074 [Clostridium neonatale]
MFFGKDKKNLIKYKHIKIYKKKHCYRVLVMLLSNLLVI